MCRRGAGRATARAGPKRGPAEPCWAGSLKVDRAGRGKEEKGAGLGLVLG